MGKTLKLDEGTRRSLLEKAISSGPDKDPISEWYEERLAKDEGRMTGQVYTPPSIAYLMARMALIKGIRRVLDPACGSGAFLRAMVLAARDEGIGPLELVGLDRLKMPAELARLNAKAVRTRGSMHEVEVMTTDFLSYRPSSKFDVVIGNPPYMRQEKVARKVDGSAMDRRADLYAYFLEHAAGLLREGGRLVFIVPDKWMDVAYGEGLKGLILDKFCLNTVLYLGSNVFERAEVDTVIVSLTRSEDRDERASTNARFVRLDKDIGTEGVLGLVDTRRAVSGSMFEMAEMPQGRLDPRSRWSHLLRAPPVFKEMLAAEAVVPFGSLGGVVISRGITTNLTELFFPTRKDIEEVGIPDRFMAPAIKSPKEFDGLVMDKAPRKLLLLPEKVDPKDGGTIKRILSWGEERRWGKGRSRKVRVKDLPSFKEKGDQWPHLKVGPPGDVIVPKFVREGRPRFIWNRARAHASDAFQTISVEKGTDMEVLLGGLNSVVGALSCELAGRVEGRGLLQILTYELGGMAVLDPWRPPVEARGAIIDGYRNLISSGSYEELDVAVVRAIFPKGWEERSDDMQKAYARLSSSRLARSEVSVVA